MVLVIMVGLPHQHIPNVKMTPNKNVCVLPLQIFHKLNTNWKTSRCIYFVAGGSPETNTGVSALHGISLQGFYPMQLPQLTPGLSQYVKDDLTEHVRGWPAESCERQV